MNRLAGATSPYLLQHAGNPVDWYPWGDEAFAAARERDVPIFLSVGYAACHWCHVMERESFEDATTAAFLNEHFVSVKVDREERPDVDGIYMDAVQAMTGSGGWPMSVFLTPDAAPFYAGTYFPDAPRHGLPSFRQVLEAIAGAWGDRRAEVATQASRIAGTMAAAIAPATSAVAAYGPLSDAAFEAVSRSFDERWGGFGGAPKFPQPGVLGWLLRLSVRDRPGALDMVTRTLDAMADGGIHDQVGGGFARYSLDAAWHVPHFEKMLSDNAQLLRLYADTWLVTRDARYEVVATRTADYLMRELRQPEGGFSSSQDADSEGVEGRFYVWTYEELASIGGPAVADAFGATPNGNWEGTNVLWRPEPAAVVAERHGISVTDLDARIDDARRRLFDRRAERIPPAVDDKVVAAWNGLAIRALAVAGRALGRDGWTQAAITCASFLWEELVTGDLLVRSWRAGQRADIGGFLDDHALVGLGLLTVYETTGDATWFDRARALAERIVDSFSGPDGGLFQTAADASPLLLRPRDQQDGATPSGTSAAAELLGRLALLTGESRFEDAAAGAIRSLGDLMARAPLAFGDTLSAADLLEGPPLEIAIIGDPADARTKELTDTVVRARYLPNAVLAIGDRGDGVPLLEGRTMIDGRPTAYVCERFACKTPVTTAIALAEQLESAAGH